MPYGFDQAAWDQAKAEALDVLRGRASRRYGQTISYTDFVGSLSAIRIDPHDMRLSHFLEEIVVDEHRGGRPLLTVLVVHRHGDLMPGDGFFEIADQLGFNMDDREAFWVAEFNRVTDFWRGANRP